MIVVLAIPGRARLAPGAHQPRGAKHASVAPLRDGVDRRAARRRHREDDHFLALTLMLRSFVSLQIAYLLLGLAMVGVSLRAIARTFPRDAAGQAPKSGHVNVGA